MNILKQKSIPYPIMFSFILLFYINTAKASTCSKLFQQFIETKNQVVNAPSFFKLTNLTMNTLMSASSLDKHVFDMYGHINLGLKTSSLRPWLKTKKSINEAKPSDIVGITPSKWASVARLAADIEEPINAYSDNSGSTLQILSPQATKFMGKTTPQSQYKIKELLGLKNIPSEEEARAHAKTIPRREYCSNPWCDEEARHEGILEALADQVNPEGKIARGGAFDAYEGLDHLSMDDAYFHLISRSDTEWHAGSAYLWLFAHSKGITQQWIYDVMVDELKHQAIFGGLYKYLKGDNYAERLKVMLQKLSSEIKEKNESPHLDINSIPLSLLEITYIHLKYELLIQEFLKSLPVKTLRKVYESDINLPDLKAFKLSPEDQKIHDDLMVERKKIRENLGDWKFNHQKDALKLEAFEKEQNTLISNIIKDEFSFFKDAEVFNNEMDIIIKKKIKKLTIEKIHFSYSEKLSKEELSLLKKSLQANLRDYQIFNNETVRAENLSVRFVNASEGFQVMPKAVELNLQVVQMEKITDNYSLLRIERPYLMALTSGDALRVSLTDKEGMKVTRILSLASSPNDPYIEVAVTNSDSSFKQAFQSIKADEFVSIERITSGAGLKYQEKKPAVMIAGGIGITPIRSIINRVKEQAVLDQPIKLLFSARDEAPFKSEFDQLAGSSEQFDVSYFISGDKSQIVPAEKDTKIKYGKLSKDDLKMTVENQSNETVYYIVAPQKMQEDVSKNLQELGIPTKRIIIETFGTNGESEVKNIDTVAKKNDNDEIVCACTGVTKGEILDGLLLGTPTKAGTGCGSCISTVKKIQKDMEL